MPMMARSPEPARARVDRCGQDVIGQAGQGRSHRLETIEADQVPGRDTKQFEPLAPGQGGGRGGVEVGPAVEVGQDVERPGVHGHQPAQMRAGRGHGHGRGPQAGRRRPDAPRTRDGLR